MEHHFSSIFMQLKNAYIFILFYWIFIYTLYCTISFYIILYYILVVNKLHDYIAFEACILSVHTGIKTYDFGIAKIHIKNIWKQS